MKNNIGLIDRVSRIVLGLALILLASTGIIGYWGWIGVIPLATGFLRFCPVYSLLGFSTCPLKK
ncbi:MAG: DUF2892 domain-containing protein [Zoogloeaceae bacterium]|jgi:hypothetical protein|nr:DUF2892 domain-containing protein [Zoogloeaceae bacterium]